MIARSARSTRSRTCRLVAEICLENKSERARAAARRAIDEVEVRGEDCVHPLLVVVGGGQCIPNRRDQCVGVSVDQRQVQLELAREMLVQHGFRYAGPFGDVVHRGTVVPLGYEDLLGSCEQLSAPRDARQPASSAGLDSCRHPDGPPLVVPLLSV
jgi:hypothetical protein